MHCTAVSSPQPYTTAYTPRGAWRGASAAASVRPGRHSQNTAARKKRGMANRSAPQVAATARYPASSRIVQAGAHRPRLGLAHTGRTVQIAAVFICFLLAAPRIPQESGALCTKDNRFLYPGRIRAVSKVYPYCIQTVSGLPARKKLPIPCLGTAAFVYSVFTLQVCLLWRAVQLYHPSGWVSYTYIYFSSSSPARDMISYSSG